MSLKKKQKRGATKKKYNDFLEKRPRGGKSLQFTPVVAGHVLDGVERQVLEGVDRAQHGPHEGVDPGKKTNTS